MTATPIRLDALEPLLRELVASDSSNPPGDERRIVAVLTRAAQSLGLPAPRVHARDAQRPNLIVEVGAGSPSMLVGAHMDTVPAGDLGAWSGDPLTLRREHGRHVGLGVADMKGAAAALLVAAEAVQRCLGRGRLVCAFTADEEAAGGYGVPWLCAEGLIDADAAILLEPGSVSERSWDGLYVAHRGSCVVRLRAHGAAGHSALPLEPRWRAGAAFARALAALEEGEPFAATRHPVDCSGPLVNVATTVRGGISPWQHPETLEATIEIRTVPGMAERSVLAELREELERAGAGDGVELVIESWSPPSRSAEDTRLLGAVEWAAAHVLGRVPPRAVFPAFTEAAYLDAAGIPTLPALGPGSVLAIHRPDEWLPIEDLRRTPRLLVSLVLAYLGGSA